MTLKYYIKEDRRWRPLTRHRLRFDTCKEMAAALFEFYQVPPIPVGLGKRPTGYSWYHPRKKIIQLDPTALDALTIVHEIAHYVEELFFRKRKKKRPYHHHNATHRRLVDQGCAFISSRYSHLCDPTSLAMTVEADAANHLHGRRGALFDAIDERKLIIRKYLKTLPAMMVCPSCGEKKCRNNFGVRVIKSDPMGIPVKMTRQSYCKNCR